MSIPRFSKSYGSLAEQPNPRGEYNSCGFASDGHTYCWGNNSDYQVGDRTTGWSYGYAIGR